MKKLYYIESEVFLRDMVEALCKQNQELECYTTDEGQNSLYFFQDLKPDFILINWETIAAYESELFAELEEVSHIEVGLTAKDATSINENWKAKAALIIEKPLEAKSLLKKIFS